MTKNTNSTEIGVAYDRIPRLIIDYPVGAMPQVRIEHCDAVKLKDGSVWQGPALPPCIAELNFATDAQTPIPLVHPDTGEPLGEFTNLQTALLHVLAVARDLQTKAPKE